MKSDKVKEFWVQTVSGKKVTLNPIGADPIPVADLIYAICRIPRFNGHTAGPIDLPYTVGEHSILVHDLMDQKFGPDGKLSALIHDLHEGITGDMITPLKWALKDPASGIDKGIDMAVRRLFGLPEILDFDTEQAVKVADLMALAIERRDLMATCEVDWDLPIAPVADVQAKLRKPSDTHARFTALVESIQAKRLLNITPVEWPPTSPVIVEAEATYTGAKQ